VILGSSVIDKLLKSYSNISIFFC